VPTPPFTTWWDLVSRTVGLPAASAVVVLEAGALDATGVEAAGCDAEVAAGDGEAVEPTELEADAEVGGFGEFPPHATRRAAVSATANTVRFDTKRSDGEGTGKASSNR